MYRQCADTVKKMALELGGNAPFIVFNSADLDKAVDGLMIAKYRNMGQTCVSANRIFVQDQIYDAFVEKVKTRMEEYLVLGRYLLNITMNTGVAEMGGRGQEGRNAPLPPKKYRFSLQYEFSKKKYWYFSPKSKLLIAIADPGKNYVLH